MAAESVKPRVVLGVAGGIAAYKSCEVLRSLTESGHRVDVIPTEAALNFVGAATFEALSSHPVTTGVFSDIPDVRHVSLGRKADVIVVVPATADLIARMTLGRADDLLTASLLAARCPVLIAPAMHTEMWEHPATRANIATLRARGVAVVGPAIGRLTGKDTGAGRLAEPSEIAELAKLLIQRPDALRADLAGRRVLVTAGGTREALDPVRFLTNRSSGKQGLAIARVAAARGAEVTFIAANVQAPDPAGSRVIRVESAEQMQEAVTSEAKEADVVIMAAAVSDFRPRNYSGSKIKKTAAEPDTVELTKNPDILAGLVRERTAGAIRSTTLITGFAAETGDAEHTVIDYARAKLERKGCDLLLVNSVAAGGAFESDNNAGVVLGADGTEVTIADCSKTALAARLLDVIAARLSTR